MKDQIHNNRNLSLWNRNIFAVILITFGWFIIIMTVTIPIVKYLGHPAIWSAYIAYIPTIIATLVTLESKSLFELRTN